MFVNDQSAEGVLDLYPAQFNFCRARVNDGEIGIVAHLGANAALQGQLGRLGAPVLADDVPLAGVPIDLVHQGAGHLGGKDHRTLGAQDGGSLGSIQVNSLLGHLLGQFRHHAPVVIGVRFGLLALHVPVAAQDLHPAHRPTDGPEGLGAVLGLDLNSKAQTGNDVVNFGALGVGVLKVLGPFDKVDPDLVHLGPQFVLDHLAPGGHQADHQIQVDLGLHVLVDGGLLALDVIEGEPLIVLLVYLALDLFPALLGPFDSLLDQVVPLAGSLELFDRGLVLGQVDGEEGRVLGGHLALQPDEEALGPLPALIVRLLAGDDNLGDAFLVGGADDARAGAHEQGDKVYLPPGRLLLITLLGAPHDLGKVLRQLPVFITCPILILLLFPLNWRLGFFFLCHSLSLRLILTGRKKSARILKNPGSQRLGRMRPILKKRRSRSDLIVHNSVISTGRNTSLLVRILSDCRLSV